MVFLGNPGKEYEGTRHNAGFTAAEEFEKQQGVKINRLKFRALTGTCEIDGKKLLLMKPQTYMNLSGEAVREAASFYKIPAEKVLVVSDEMSLPVGKIRFKPRGSAGGHNGLKNIILHLGTENFPRIRIGVGAPPGTLGLDTGKVPGTLVRDTGKVPGIEWDVKDWVLSGFSGKDAEDFRDAAARAAEAVAFYIGNGAEKTMNKFN